MATIDLPFYDSDMLNKLQGEELMKFVGQCIYPSIENSFGMIFAPKITGMIIDLDAKVDFNQLLTYKMSFANKEMDAIKLIMGSQ